VHSDPLVLIAAPSVRAAFPERFWIPDGPALAAIEPGMLVKVRVVDLADGDADFWDSDVVWVGVEDVGESRVHGVVVDSPLEGSGLDEGSEIAVAFDRIFDVLPVDEEGRPGLNLERVRFGLGKVAVIGLTEIRPDERVERRQFVGTLSSVEPLEGIAFELPAGERFVLPPDGRALEEARPGTYRLRPSGERVEDPAYACSWTVHVSELGRGASATGFQRAR